MRRHWLNSLAAGVVLLLLGSGAQAQQKHEMTVKEAVETAFKNVTELKNLQLDYRLQEAKNNEIKGAALPQVTGNLGINHYLQLPLILFPDGTEAAIYNVLAKEDVRNGSGAVVPNRPTFTLRQVSFQQPWNASAGATLNQLLFQPDVFVGLQARKTALDLASINMEVAKERIKDSAYKRYYAILIAEKQLTFIKDGVKRLEKLLNDNTAMYKNGFAEKLDIDKVQVQLNNLKTTQNIIESGIRLSYSAMKFSLGLPQKDTIVLKDSLSIDAIKADILADGESFQYENRKEIQQLGVAKKLQELDIKRYKLGVFPTVAAFINYSVNGQGQKFILTDRNAFWLRSSLVGLNINVPIFDGFQRKYKMQQAKLNLQKTTNSIDFVKQAIDFEQTITKESLGNALLNLDIQKRNIDLAQQVYNTTKKKFEQGLGSSFEILLAENELQEAQSNYFNAMYNAIVAKISYQKSIGKL
jgi:outer membrane protein